MEYTKKNLPPSFYNAWQNMKRRCNGSYVDAYKWYGARGITYDEKWETIQGFSEDMFPTWKQGLTLDRIDVNGNYTKDNCRWITHKEQCYNRTSNIRIEIEGVVKTLTEWSLESGVAIETIWSRYNRGVKGKDLIKVNKRKVLEKQSGVKFINWSKRDCKWVVQKYINGKRKRFGSFDSLEDAKKLVDELGL